jgi:hypothetical protein
VRIFEPLFHAEGLSMNPEKCGLAPSIGAPDVDIAAMKPIVYVPDKQSAIYGLILL